MTELTPLARKLRTVYFSATTDRDDTRAWWNKVAETAEAELAAPRLHVLARRLPDWPTDDLADLLAELDEAVTL